MISVRSIRAPELTVVLGSSLPTVVRGCEAMPPGEHAAAASVVLQSGI